VRTAMISRPIRRSWRCAVCVVRRSFGDVHDAGMVSPITLPLFSLAQWSQGCLLVRVHGMQDHAARKAWRFYSGAVLVT